MQKIFENLKEVEKTILIIDHLAYHPLINEKKVILKCLTEIKNAFSGLISVMLILDYTKHKIALYHDQKMNFRTFILKTSKNYDITQQELEEIIKIFRIFEAHKKSTMEFEKNGKIVILSENSEYESIDPEEIRKYLNTTKTILDKVKSRMMRKI